MALESSGTGKADEVEHSCSQRRGWPAGLGQMCREGISARWEPGMQCKGAGQPWEELNTGSRHGEQEESKGASGHIWWEVSRPPVATSFRPAFSCHSGPGCRRNSEGDCLLVAAQPHPQGALLKSDFPNTPATRGRTSPASWP